MNRTALALGLLVLASCATRPDGAPASSPTSTSASEPAPVRDQALSGPQSYTPEAKPKARTRAVSQRWSAHVGATDHRTTMAESGGALYVGTREGVVVLDAKTGARKHAMPPLRGHVVGVALDGDRVYAASAGGELVAATRAGAPIFRTEIGAGAATPPTLADFDGDGALDVAVGDVKGRAVVFDGRTGKRRWAASLSGASDAHPSAGAGLAAADLDGDGIPEIVMGTEGGTLGALRGKSGDTLWLVKRTSPLRAAPLVADVDADKKPEVIAGWADGDVAIVDGKSGSEIWTQHVEEDDGDPTGVLATPTPLAGPRSGVLVVPTARWGADDCVVLLGAYDRVRRSQQGRVTSSPVVGVVDPDEGVVEAVVGTQRGDVVSFAANGTASLLYHLPSAIEAPMMFADLEGDGTQELLVLTKDGNVTALALHVANAPVLGRARGSARNDGVLVATDLGWKLP